MIFWNTIRSWFTPTVHAKKHIAVLAPRSSNTVEKFINLTIQQMRATSPCDITITQFDDISDTHNFSLFIKEAQAGNFDSIFAVTAKPAQMALRAYNEYGITIPSLVISYEELLPHPLPHHFSVLMVPNNSTFNHQLIATSFTNITKVAVCTNAAIARYCQEITDLKTLLTDDHINVVLIDLNQSENEIEKQLKTTLAPGDIVYTPNDALAFVHMQLIAQIARTKNATIIASELHAINLGADIATGYPLEGVATEGAQKMLQAMQQHKPSASFIQTTREIRLRGRKHAEWIGRFLANRPDHTYKIIGTKDNERSAPAQ